MRVAPPPVSRVGRRLCVLASRTMVAVLDNIADGYFNESLFGSRVRGCNRSRAGQRAGAYDAQCTPRHFVSTCHTRDCGQVDAGVAWKLMQEHLPDMCAHLEAMGASAILPTNAWLLELFAYRFPPHTAIRFWDWMLSAVRVSAMSAA